MKYIITLSLLPFQMSLLSPVFAEEPVNPYTNVPPGMDVQKMVQAQEERRQKDQKKKAERAAVSKAIADEELARAKAEANINPFNDPYSVAEVRTKKRMAPIYEKWKQEDAAENAPLEIKAQQNFQQYQQTGNHQEFGKQYQEMLKQMGVELPVSQ